MTSTASTVPRIIVGVDGSEGSKQALRWAHRIATAEGATIDAIAAWEVAGNIGWAAFTEYNPKADVEKLLTATVDEVFGGRRPAGLRLATLQGDAARVLLTASQDALMLVVGSRGHGGFMGLLLGSVSAKVAEHATCPVLVVHSGKPAEQTQPAPTTEALAPQPAPAS